MAILADDDASDAVLVIAGWVGLEPDRVTTTTSSPRSASKSAVVVPIEPAPTTMCLEMEDP
jgi:hypothetical protein